MSTGTAVGPGNDRFPNMARGYEDSQAVRAARSTTRRPATTRDDALVDSKVEHELEGVLRWARAMREGMEREPERREEFQMQGHAYVGGVLTTLDHLGLVSREAHSA